MMRQLSLLTALLLASACSAARNDEQVDAAIQLAHENVGSSQGSAQVEAEAARVQGAFDAAATAVGAALAPDRTAPSALWQRSLVRATDDADPDRIARLLEVAPEAADADLLTETQITLHTLRGEHAEASTLAWETVRAASDEARPAWVRRWYTALMADPAYYQATPRTLTPGEDVDRIEHLDRGTSLIFRFRHDGATTHAFKPEQTVHVTSIRGELASWRLCRVIHCALTLPETEEVRISEADFLSLTGLTSVDEIPVNFVREHSELVWYTDAQGQRWLYGVIKAWIPGFVRFPIETTSLWEALTRIGVTERSLRAIPFADIAAPIALTDPERYPQILGHGGRENGYTFARQVSDLHVFDFLTNNWDRYRTGAPGANCQWDDGHFVSIDNGATFQVNAEEHAYTAVRYRIDRVQVFSRTVIDAIRWMDTEAFYDVLFSESPHGDRDRERYAYFLERRQWLLDYVDGLVEAHGEDRVYLFP